MASDVKVLAKCVKQANGNAAAIAACEAAFQNSGGKPGVQEGGKVFSDQAGAQVLIAAGGKVFSLQS